ncbi:hypothetical protein D3C81_1278060 [compost metagenome]
MSSCSMPSTPLSGVRISWLILARKRLLAWLSTFARSAAWRERKPSSLSVLMRSARPMERVISSMVTPIFTTVAPNSPSTSTPSEPVVVWMKANSSTPQARV